MNKILEFLTLLSHPQKQLKKQLPQPMLIPHLKTTEIEVLFGNRFNDQHNENDDNQLGNLDKATVNRRPLLDEEVTNKI